MVLQGSEINQIPNKYSQAESTKFMVLTVVSLLCTAAVPLASTVVYCLRHRSHHRLKQNFSSLGGNAPGDATSTYQVCPLPRPSSPPSGPLHRGSVWASVGSGPPSEPPVGSSVRASVRGLRRVGPSVGPWVGSFVGDSGRGSCSLLSSTRPSPPFCQAEPVMQ